MREKTIFRVVGAVLSLTLVTFLFTDIACAEEIEIEKIYHFRSIHSSNSVNFVIGDRLLFGADILPNGDLVGPNDEPPPDGRADSDDTSPPSDVTAFQNSVEMELYFIPGYMLPNSFVRTVSYNTSLFDPWRLVITNGADTAEVFTPDVVGVGAMPFVTNMSLSGSGATPTFNWTVPVGFAPDAITIKIYDLEDFIGEGGVGGGGTAKNIYNKSLVDPTATSFTVPEGKLLTDHLYSVAINLDSHRAFSPENPKFSLLESRSRSFFDFSTEILADPGDAPVYLPTVDPNGSPSGGPVYTFDVTVVEGQTIFIDPLVALGYYYQIGTGDPSFASVVLPEVGDNVFSLYLIDGAGFVFEDILVAGAEYFFNPGGVDRFLILGIEASAGLDPNNATAFVTGLTFVEDGSFTGTMTPITFNPINVDFDPDTLNLKSKGSYVTCYLELPLGYDLSSINVDNVKLIVDGNEIYAKSSPTGIGDYDSDDVPDLMVKFDRSSVQEVAPLGEVVVSVAVKEGDDVILQGHDTIFVIDKGKEHLSEDHDSVAE